MSGFSALICRIGMSDLPELPFELDVLRRYHAGESDARERAMVQTWVAGSPRRAAVVGAFAPDVPAAPYTFDADNAWATLRERIVPRHIPSVHANGRVTTIRGSIGSVPRISQQQLRRVALGALGIGAAALVVWGGRTANHTERSGAAHVYATQIAERSAITLHDGTRVRLGPSTTLTVADDFGNHTRTVTLRGEAYFDVRSATGAPFVVRTGSVSTRVLGTSFGVTYDNPAAPARVTVVSGRVVVGGRRGAVTVFAGATAIASDSSATTSTSADIHSYTDWPNGRLVFDEERVLALLTTVEKWYGYRFVLQDSLLSTRRVSVVLKVGDATDMFTALKGTLDVDLAFDGYTVTLTPHQNVKRPHQRSRTDVFNPLREVGR